MSGLASGSESAAVVARDPALAALEPAAAAPTTRALLTMSALGKGAELISQAALVIAAPLALGAQDYGTFALALAVVGIVSHSLSLGGPSVMARFVPAAAPDARAALARALAIRVGWWRAIKVGAVAAVAAGLVITAPEQFPLALTALVVAAIALDTVAALGFQIALGFERRGVWAARWAAQNTVLVVAMLVGEALAGVLGAIASIAFASGCMLVWSASVVGPRLAAAPRGAAPPAGLLRFATLQGLNGLFTLTALRGGVVAVALLGASKMEMSFAALAFSLVAAAVFTVFQVFTVQLPGLVATESPLGAEASARRLAAQLLPVVVLLAVLAALMAGPAVPLVFGDSFAGARDAVAIAFAILPLAPLTALATQTATLRLRPGARALAAGAGTTVLAAVAAVAVPAHGAVGASAALVPASAATLLVAARLLPGVFGPRLLAAGLAGATLVLAIGVLGG